MKILGRFLRLPARDRRLLLRAGLMVALSGAGLRLIPFSLVRLLLRLFGRRLPALPDPSADRIAWAVAAAGRRLPGARSCLAQALAAETLLARRGVPALLRIGVARDPGGRFEAHAWVESDGRVLIGEPTQRRFTALASFPAASPARDVDSADR